MRSVFCCAKAGSTKAGWRPAARQGRSPRRGGEGAWRGSRPGGRRRGCKDRARTGRVGRRPKTGRGPPPLAQPCGRMPSLIADVLLQMHVIADRPGSGPGTRTGRTTNPFTRFDIARGLRSCTMLEPGRAVHEPLMRVVSAARSSPGRARSPPWRRRVEFASFQCPALEPTRGGVGRQEPARHLRGSEETRLMFSASAPSHCGASGVARRPASRVFHSTTWKPTSTPQFSFKDLLQKLVHRQRQHLAGPARWRCRR